jgi:hypothetical protein
MHRAILHMQGGRWCAHKSFFFFAMHKTPAIACKLSVRHMYSYYISTASYLENLMDWSLLGVECTIVPHTA